MMELLEVLRDEGSIRDFEILEPSEAAGSQESYRQTIRIVVAPPGEDVAAAGRMQQIIERIVVAAAEAGISADVKLEMQPSPSAPVPPEDGAAAERSAHNAELTIPVDLGVRRSFWRRLLRR